MSKRFAPDAARSAASSTEGAVRSAGLAATGIGTGTGARARTRIETGTRMAMAFLAILAMFTSASSLSGCVMSEEMKRIDQVKKAQRERAMEGSTNLTGEQIFLRSCNTCHPSAKAGMGPSLEAMNAKFPEDQALKQFIRKGKGMMPGQNVERINDDELNNLIGYLRGLEFSK